MKKCKKRLEQITLKKIENFRTKKYGNFYKIKKNFKYNKKQICGNFYKKRKLENFTTNKKKFCKILQNKNEK